MSRSEALGLRAVPMGWRVSLRGWGICCLLVGWLIVGGWVVLLFVFTGGGRGKRVRWRSLGEVGRMVVL